MRSNLIRARLAVVALLEEGEAAIRVDAVTSIHHLLTHTQMVTMARRDHSKALKARDLQLATTPRILVPT
jgi:hypothetical protein